MAEKRLIIALGDSNCAGAVRASDLSGLDVSNGWSPTPSDPSKGYYSTQTQYKIWNFEYGKQEWEPYNVFSGNPHWESDVVGPEFPIKIFASGEGTKVRYPSGTDLHIFKASKYQTGLLKWDNSLDDFGSATPEGVNYTSLWPQTRDGSFWAATGAASSYGLVNQFSAAVADLSAGGSNEVIVDGMYIILGTLDAIAPYGARAYQGLLTDFVINFYHIASGLGCTLSSLDTRRNIPVTVLVQTHNEYDYENKQERVERFRTIRKATLNSAVDLNLLGGLTDAYCLDTSSNPSRYPVMDDNVHYDLSGIYNLGIDISDFIYPWSGNPLPTPPTNAQPAIAGPGGGDFVDPKATFAVAEGITAGKVGFPKVKSYGSSYGIYQGNRLGDYKTPRPDDLNNKDAKDAVEFKDFDRTVKDYVLSKLGYPVVDVELDDFQLNVCIDEAISRLEFHAPDWMTQYATFEVTGSVNVYELPQVIADNLTDVWYKRDFFKFGASPGSLEFDFAIMFFTNTGLFNNYNVSQYLLMQQYLKQVKNVLGQMSTWQLINNRHLHLFPIPDSTGESVILEFRAFDPNTIHHAYKSWVQRYTLCIAKEILGGIRGKYQTLPGPGGGTRLNGEALIREAAEEKEKLMEELTTEIEGPPLFDIV